MLTQVPSAGVVIDQPLVEEPLDGAALRPRIPKRLPGRHQVGVLLVQLVLEPSEGAAAADRPTQPTPGAVIADPLDEVEHVSVPHRGGQRIDRNEVKVLKVYRVRPVDPSI